jgi:two-component system chemotaxis sensor kinase CheA
MLDFRMLTDAPLAELHEHFRYVPDQVRGGVVTAAAVSECAVEESARAVDNAAAGAVAPRRASSAPEIESAIDAVLASQRELLSLPADVAWHAGRTASAIETLAACARAAGTASLLDALHAAAARSHGPQGAEPLLAWIDAFATVPAPAPAPVMEVAADVMTCRDAASPGDGDARSARRPEEGPAAPRSLKVDQVKIDRLMDLIGEMIVSKNALPYLADRAEDVYGSRELAREIKAQYATINRIAEEMQDAIMQVRMMPVSFVFQRFPRLVRDTSRRLGKDVQLVLDGEDAEADKNIIEALSDPLVHIVRNSLDHGFELPEARRAAGKPVTGTLTIRARQEGDRVIIEIRDDGKGIDPEVVKRKAYASGLIDEQTLERMSDAEAINLIFAPGFSTMDVVSDLSGRGVGMDVVRTAIERVNGSVSLHSERGRGTRLRLSLPLSMAVTHVMIVETNARLFGLPMDCVVETVRVPRSAVHGIKQSEATVLRGQVVPLRSLNRLLQVPVAQRTNGDDELAVLVVRTSDGTMGLVVDDFQSTADVILKPLAGMLAGLPMYTGSALMGDGSVLMVLNAKELL